LEDQERRVEGPEKESGVKTKGPNEKTKKWTVMIMGRIGKVRSFKISPRLVFWSSLFLALYLTFSILIIHRWITLEKMTKQDQVRIEDLEGKLKRTEKDLFKFQQHVAVLDNYINSMEKGAGTPVASEVPDAGKPEPEEPAPEVAVSEKPEEPEPPREPIPGIADVEKFELTQKEGSVTVSFNLVNSVHGEEPLSGYIHIIATGSVNGKSWWKIYPRGEVENDFPVSYRAGHPFIIQRFKPVQGSFEYRQEEGPPDSIRIVVYDSEGRLIYNSSFEVDHEP
jgi:hypothetical protein